MLDKKKLVLLLCLIIVGSTTAQFKIGILGGANYSNFRGSEIETMNGETRFSSGILFDLSLNHIFGIRCEPMVVQTSAQIPWTALSQDLTLRMTSLEFPLLYRITMGQKLQPFLLVGPVIGVILATEMSVDRAGKVFNGDADHIIANWEFGFSLGGGLSYPVGRIQFFVEGRYTYGLNNLNQGGIVQASSGPDVIERTIDDSQSIKSRGLQVLLGLAVSL